MRQRLPLHQQREMGRASEGVSEHGHDCRGPGRGRPDRQIRRPQRGRQPAPGCGRRATEAGVDVLRAGGSAIDAAIATSAVLSVVYPHMTGLGGDAFWLIHDGASGEVRYLNGGGKAAAGATLSSFEKRGLNEIPLRGILPATLTVPGAVASWIEAHDKYGRLHLRRVLESAI